ncbi:sulfatase [Cyclobacterium xiamenense]|uniref:sulfatase n=1 Tax=Cyclobacterium xiamenense TaxID=1297121 RepID=UPI0035D0901A
MNHGKNYLLISQIFLLSALSISCISKGSQRLKTPNIIVILTDDLGWADTGYQGNRYFETPNIDKMASEGLIMNRFYPSAANCAPSRACLLTGMYGPRHGVYIPQGYARGGNVEHMRFKVPVQGKDSSFFNFHVSVNHVEPGFTSLAELLKPAGYVSSRLGKWHIGDDNQGFDENSANGVPGYITNINGTEDRFYDDTSVAEKLTDSAIDFIKRNKDKPFFLYLSHWEVHTPMAAQQDRIEYYRGKAERLGLKNANDVYAAEVEVLDVSLGRMLRALGDFGLEDNTIVIFTSDNGGLSSQTENAPLRGGKGSYYEGGIRVPFVVRWPASIPAGKRSEVAAIGVDFMPTFAEITGASLPETQPIDGHSLLDVWKNPGSSLERPIFFHFPLYLGGDERTAVLPKFGGSEPYWRAVPSSIIMKGPWKLIYYYEYESYEIYNLEEDISESVNLAGSLPDLENELLMTLRKWVEETDAPVPKVLNK